MPNVISKIKSATAKQWRITALTVSTLMLAVAPFINVGTASALSDCASLYVCLYSNSNFGGTSVRWYNPTLGCHNVANSTTSSVYNHSLNGVTYYDASNCTGGYYFYDGPHGYRTNLANDCWVGHSPCNSLTSANDKISSFWVQ